MEQGDRAVADAPGQASKLSLPSTVIGRRKDCDVVVGDSGTSKAHCRIDRAGDKYTLVDLDSQNGTFVNEEKISARELARGDRLRIGYSIFDFSLAAGGEAVLVFVKRVKPASAARQDSAEGDADAAVEEAPENLEADPPWVDASSGEPLPASAAYPPGEVAAGQDRGLNDDQEPAKCAEKNESQKEQVSVPLSGDQAQQPAPACPETPSRRTGAAPESRLPHLAAAAIACTAALAAASIFGVEIRSAIGFKPSPAPVIRQPEISSPALDRTAANEVAADAVKPLLDEIETLRAQMEKMDRLSAASGETHARLTDMDLRLADLETGMDRIGRYLSDLREAAKAAALRQAGATSGQPEGVAPPPPLSPEEALFRDVLEALKKKE